MSNRKCEIGLEQAGSNALTAVDNVASDHVLHTVRKTTASCEDRDKGKRRDLGFCLISLPCEQHIWPRSLEIPRVACL